MERDYYSTLGIGRFASQEEIRRAFHSRILLVHPDRNPADHVAADRTRELIDAYKALTNPQTKSSYDVALAHPAPIVAACRVTESATRFWVTKTIVALVFLAMSIGLVTGVSDVLANRGRVFRPCLGAIDVSSDAPAPSPVVSSPGVSDFREWYAAEQYQMSLASGNATSNLLRAYSSAADRAFRQGNVEIGQFYTRCIRQIRDSGPRVVFQR